MNRFLNIVGVQLDIVWEDKEANFQKIRDILSKLDSKPDLIVLPETFATGFTMKSQEFSEPLMGITEKFLIEMSRKTGSAIGGSWIEANPEGMPFNTFSIARPSGIITNRYHNTYQPHHNPARNRACKQQRIFRRTDLHLFAQARHRRWLPRALQGCECDLECRCPQLAPRKRQKGQGRAGWPRGPVQKRQRWQIAGW